VRSSTRTATHARAPPPCPPPLTPPAPARPLPAPPAGFWALLFVNSFLAYFVNLTNFLVTKYTSALTLQVLGNAKGVVAVVISVMCFRNPVTVYSMLGYGITVGGVVLYSHAKKLSTKRAEASRKPSSAKGGGRAAIQDLEQPMSPFGQSAANNGGSSELALSASERQALLIKAAGETMGKQEPLSGPGAVMAGRGLPTMASSGSERIMARGFSSIFEA
jgi:hypothetical protein